MISDIDPKQFPLRVGDKVFIIKTDFNARIQRPQLVTITKALNMDEGYYEAVAKDGEVIKDLLRFQLKKKK